MTRRASRGQPATGRGSLRMCLSWCRTGLLSVPVAPTPPPPAPPPPPAGGPAGRGRSGGRAGRGHLPPLAARDVQAVALGHAGGGVGHVGVQRVPVVGGLD